MKENLYFNRTFIRSLALAPSFLGLFSILLIPSLSYAHDRGGEAAEISADNSADQNRAEEMTMQLSSSIAGYQSAEDGRQKVFLEERLKAQIEQRRQLIQQLAEDDPVAALRIALPDKLKQGLPKSIRDLLEQNMEAEGELRVLIEDYDDPSLSRSHYLLTTPQGQRYSLHFADQPAKMQSGSKVRVKGLSLNESVLRVTGENDGMILVDDSESSLLMLESNGEGAVVQTRSASAGGLNIFGGRNTLVFLVNFHDQSTNKPWSTSSIDGLVFGTVSDFFYENSYQQAWLDGDVVGWYTVPVDSDDCDIGRISSEARSDASNAGINLSSYNHYVYIFPSMPCGFGGIADVGGNPSEAWINGNPNLKKIAHEMGHNFGLRHSHAMECGATTLGDNCSFPAYGDTADVMGWITTTAHVNAFQKNRLGWLNSSVTPPVTTVGSSGTYALETYASKGSNSKALKILKSDDASGQTWYYLEYRQAIGYDSELAYLNNSNLVSGVIVHTGNDDDGDTSYMLDMNPNSLTVDDRNDAALDVGDSFTDTEAGVTFTVETANSNGATVSVSLNSSTCIRRNPALSLSPSEHWAEAGDTVSYNATVTNLDSSNCSSSGFDIWAGNLPSGWTANTKSLNLAPGQSGTVGISVTSSSTAGDGYHNIGINTENASNSSYNDNGTVTYVVTTDSGNSAPIAVDDSETLLVVAPVTIDVLANDSDPDNDPLTVISHTNGSKGTVVNNGNGTLTYTPGRRFKNSDSFTYMISDSMQSASASVSVTLQKSGGKGGGGNGGGKPKR